MKEALESLNALQDTYNKLTKNYNSANAYLSDLKEGKSSVKSMFSYRKNM